MRSSAAARVVHRHDFVIAEETPERAQHRGIVNDDEHAHDDRPATAVRGLWQERLRRAALAGARGYELTGHMLHDRADSQSSGSEVGERVGVRLLGAALDGLEAREERGQRGVDAMGELGRDRGERRLGERGEG